MMALVEIILRDDATGGFVLWARSAEVIPLRDDAAEFGGFGGFVR